MKLAAKLLVTITMVGMCLGLVGCESGGSDSAGNSTIAGNIASVDLDTAVVLASMLRPTVRDIAKSAGVIGITVRLEGAGLSTTTRSDGSFTFTDLPAGDYILVFVIGDVEIRFPLGVGETQSVVIPNITIGRGAAIASDPIQRTSIDTSSESEESGGISAGGELSATILGTWSGTFSDDHNAPFNATITFHVDGTLTAVSDGTSGGTYSLSADMKTMTATIQSSENPVTLGKFSPVQINGDEMSGDWDEADHYWYDEQTGESGLANAGGTFILHRD
jgi:hypothetical protein